MSAHPIDADYRLKDPLPSWCLHLGLDRPDERAAQLVRAAVDDPMDLIGYVAIGASYFGADFGALIDWLAKHEPTLRTVLPAVAATMTTCIGKGDLPHLTQSDLDGLPKWLRDIDKLECSGFMRRFDHADRSASSYLIEVRFADSQISTSRLAIAHNEVDRVTGFVTMPCTLRHAARLYRDRGTGQMKRTYRRVKPETACFAMIDSLTSYTESDAFLEDRDSPRPWLLKMPVLMLLLKAALPMASGQIEHV